ncbi:MAG: putative metal-binding motif-containing protein [Deltaproteobacteria bacterium]|nr:putative metal-binding motif-containing protein [Deltaproteobacteria bacterium]
MKKSLSLLIFMVIGFGSISAYAQDISIENCKAHAILNPNTGKVDVEYTARVCSSDLSSWSSTQFTVWFYPNLSSSPGYPANASLPHLVKNEYFDGWIWSWYWNNEQCKDVKTTEYSVSYPQGVYNLWCVVDPTGSQFSNPPDTKGNNVYGGTPWRIGPDLWVGYFWYEIKGAELKYKFKVCNSGTHKATNFRVGLYFNRPTAPGPGEYSDTFKSFSELAPPSCYRQYYWGGYEWHCDPVCTEEDMNGDDHPDPIEIIRNPTPNNFYTSWLKADSGEFVEEASETNNASWPLFIDMANPDLVIKEFTAEVSKNPPYRVDYYVKVCNEGAEDSGKYWIDLYYHRERDDPPTMGQPGDVHKGEPSLTWQTSPTGVNCVTHTFSRYDTDVGEYQSYVQADSDEFVVDPDRITNQEGPILVNVPGGSLPPGCVDEDGDGFGTGSDCGLDIDCQVGCAGDLECINDCPRDDSMIDCDDTDPDTHPGAEEFCDDDKDQNCNDTANDGCPGVDCVDEDGDGVPSGPDCSPDANDCDDSDPDRAPGNYEICGDNIDNDCDGYADDCCPGTDFCDADNDGACVGNDCPGPRDPDCVEDCNGNLDCINDCPVARDPACVAGCDGVQSCIDDCPPFLDPVCVEGCGGVQSCIDACGPPQDGDDNNPECGWLGGAEICGDHLDNDCDGHVDDGCGTTFCTDADNDGYGVGVGCTGPQDCDDTDPSISPAATENCGDGVDDNCDYVPDGMCDTCVDNDGDGYYSGNGDDPNCLDHPKDCNDTDPLIHPFGIEICGNDVDENCNLATNDTPCVDPADYEECMLLMPDVDAVESCLEDHNTLGPPDGGCLSYDTATEPPCHDAACVMACYEACGGTTTCTTFESCVNSCPEWTTDCSDNDDDGWPGGNDCILPDCDDADNTVSPGTVEICDGKDNDCDGTIDEWPENGEACKDAACLAQCTEGDTLCYEGCPDVDCIDHDGDGWGVGTDCADQDPDDNNPSIWPGAREICGDGIDQNGDGVSDDGCILCTDHDKDGAGVGPVCAHYDCDDTNPDIYPGAEEKCGTVDTNCDGKLPVATVCQDELNGCGCSHPGKNGTDSRHIPLLALILGFAGIIYRRKSRN